jgi:hypothetical protein
MKELVGKFIANIIKARLEYLYDMELNEGSSDYLKGRKEGTLLIMRDICDYLNDMGVITAPQFLKEAIPVSKEPEPVAV